MLKKITLSGLGLVLLFSPVVVSASTLSDLLAQISALRAQIAAIQGQSDANTSCVDLERTLTLNMSGSDVTDLQNYLIQKGYLAFGSNTGYFGFLTATAVGKMQVSLGLVSGESDDAYGFVGARTRAAIACTDSTVPTPAPTTPTTAAAPTITLSASPTTINQNESATISWTSSSDATSCTGTNFNPQIGAHSGNVSVSPSRTTTFSLVCAGSGGTSQQKSVTVTVNNSTVTTPTTPITATAPTVTLSASPTTIDQAGSATLSWTSSSDATSCTGTNFNPQIGAHSGSTSVSPSRTTTFSLICTGPGGTSQQKSVTVTVNSPTVTPTTANAPTATLTAQVRDSLTPFANTISANVGDVIDYVWASTGGTSWNATVSQDSGTPVVWKSSFGGTLGTTPSGTVSDVVSAIQAGHTYTIKYYTYADNQSSAVATLTVQVRGTSASVATASQLAAALESLKRILVELAALGRNH